MRVEIYWCKTKEAYLNVLRTFRESHKVLVPLSVKSDNWDINMGNTGILILKSVVKVGHIDVFRKNYPLSKVYVIDSEYDPTPAQSIKTLLAQDKINMPSHYIGRLGLEAIEVVRNFSTPEQEAGFYYGNAIKYLTRYQNKNGVEDLKKARKNLDWLIELVEKNERT